MNFYGKKPDSIVESGHLIDRHRQPRDRDEAGIGHSAQGLLGRGALPASLGPASLGPASRPPSLTPAFPPAVSDSPPLFLSSAPFCHLRWAGVLLRDPLGCCALFCLSHTLQRALLWYLFWGEHGLTTTGADGRCGRGRTGKV